MIIFDFTSKYIYGFYFLILSANFTTYLAFMHVMRSQDTPEGPRMKAKTQRWFTIMNILYGLMLPLAVIPYTAPVCNSIMIYPGSMLACNVMFLLNAGFYFYARHYNFFADNADESAPLIDKGKSAEHNEKRRKIFSEQMKSYGNYLYILSTIQVIIILLARVYIDEGDYLACTGGGYQWLYTNVRGELFIAGMMITIMMQSVMIEKFLYRIPNKFGEFDSIKVKTEKAFKAAFKKKLVSFENEAVATAVN